MNALMACFSANRKRLVSHLMALVLICMVVFPATAEQSAMASEKKEYTCEDFTYIILDDGTVEIIDYARLDDVLTIPDKLDGLTVTGIGDYVFSYMEDAWLTTVAIPDSVIRMGDNPFAGNEYLKDFIISPDHPYLAVVDGVLFSKPDHRLICYPMTLSSDHYSIPDGTLAIDGSAFCCNDSLTTVTIPDSVTSIGDEAFTWCTSLTAINIPENVNDIGENPFLCCDNLKDITVSPDNPSLVMIDGVLFSRPENRLICYPITLPSDRYSIPDGTQVIGSTAFICSSLAAIDIPDSVTSIEDRAFYECVSLTALNIPDSVTSIGDEAFSDCTSLTAITILDGVTSIGDEVFFHCDSLTAISIPDSVTSIGYSAFSCCNSLTTVNIPDSVTSIGEFAFSDCDSLAAINIPDNVNKIEFGVFTRCTSLTSIKIPDNVISIEAYAFSGCSSLTAVTIPDSVTSIGNWAFSECTSLTTITIPDSVIYIGEDAFSCEKSSSRVFIVPADSYAEQYCKAYEYQYRYPDASPV